MAGPLAGYRVVELAGIGPGPFAAMMLSDMGAEVLRVDRAGAVDPAEPAPTWDVNARGRRSVAVDLKHPSGPEVVLRLVEQADALIEGFRPGVTERLGIGPDECLARRPSLVYGRMTGWGQDGPYAQAAGRDVNYVALSGTLAMIGRAGEAPVPPLNLVGDFGGGGLLLAFGIVCGILEASRSGRGQVIDAAMVDGAALLAAMMHGLRASGEWGERGTNLLDTGAWFYEVYETADGGYVSLGPIDERSCRDLLQRIGLADDVDGLGPVPDQHRPEHVAGDEGAAWPPSCGPGPATSGARCSRAPTPASRRCWIPARHRIIRTSRSGGRSRRSAAWSSPRPRHGSAAPSPRSPGRRPDPASTPTRRWRTGVSPARRSPTSAPWAPSAESRTLGTERPRVISKRSCT